LYKKLFLTFVLKKGFQKINTDTDHRNVMSGKLYILYYRHYFLEAFLNTNQDILPNLERKFVLQVERKQRKNV